MSSCPTWRRTRPGTAAPITSRSWRWWRRRPNLPARCWRRGACFWPRSFRAAPKAYCSPTSSATLRRSSTSNRWQAAPTPPSYICWRPDFVGRELAERLVEAIAAARTRLGALAPFERLEIKPALFRRREFVRRRLARVAFARRLFARFVLTFGAIKRGFPAFCFMAIGLLRGNFFRRRFFGGSFVRGDLGGLFLRGRFFRRRFFGGSLVRGALGSLFLRGQPRLFATGFDGSRRFARIILSGIACKRRFVIGACTRYHSG